MQLVEKENDTLKKVNWHNWFEYPLTDGVYYTYVINSQGINEGITKIKYKDGIWMNRRGLCCESVKL